jgi:uncharacterized damage-inducible protein DinB
LTQTIGFFVKQNKEIMSTLTSTPAIGKSTIISNDDFLAHWQSHRELTRRVIEAFPEKELYTFSIGGMRPFAELAGEMLAMTEPGIVGIATGNWGEFKEEIPATKKELLAAWDRTTGAINEWWPKIADERFQENDPAFGQWGGPVYGTVYYFVDNEIHHRGQGYVYLRALGIEPPAFWSRGN